MYSFVHNLSVWSARPAIMPINYVFQHLPTLMPLGLDSYSVCAWDNLISYPSETSEGTMRSLEHRLLCEVLVRIPIIYLLCPGVSFDSKHDFMWDSGISDSFDTITSVSYWDILFLFTAQVCGKKKGWKVVVIEINFSFLPLIHQRIILPVKPLLVRCVYSTNSGSECWYDISDGRWGSNTSKMVKLLIMTAFLLCSPPAQYLCFYPLLSPKPIYPL